MLFFATKGLPLLLELGLLIFCVIDCAQTPDVEIRNLPKWAWLVLIIAIPLVGGVAWLWAGRPRYGEYSVHHWDPQEGYDFSRGGPIGPDDDPQFLSEMKRVNLEHEETLKLWEEDLKRREDRLRGPDGEPPTP